MRKDDGLQVVYVAASGGIVFLASVLMLAVGMVTEGFVGLALSAACLVLTVYLVRRR